MDKTKIKGLIKLPLEECEVFYDGTLIWPKTNVKSTVHKEIKYLKSLEMFDAEKLIESIQRKFHSARVKYRKSFGQKTKGDH